MFGAHKLEKMNEMHDHSNCGTTTVVSTAGAWLLAGTMADDKWPNGINQ